MNDLKLKSDISDCITAEHQFDRGTKENRFSHSLLTDAARMSEDCFQPVQLKVFFSVRRPCTYKNIVIFTLLVFNTIGIKCLVFNTVIITVHKYITIASITCNMWAHDWAHDWEGGSIGKQMQSASQERSIVDNVGTANFYLQSLL